MATNGMMTGYGNEESDGRQEKAENITITDVYELRDGEYRITAENEDGEERTLLIIPSSLVSSSPDMLYRSSEGVVGKYIRALALHDKKYAEELREGVRSRQSEIQNDIDYHNRRVAALSKEHRKLETAVGEIE